MTAIVLTNQSGEGLTDISTHTNIDSITWNVTAVGQGEQRSTHTNYRGFMLGWCGVSVLFTGTPEQIVWWKYLDFKQEDIDMAPANNAFAGHWKNFQFKLFPGVHATLTINVF